LSYYEQAAEIAGNEIYIARSRLEAARILQQMNEHERAQRMYRQVADAVPDSEEGKLARKALQQYKGPSR